MDELLEDEQYEMDARDAADELLARYKEDGWTWDDILRGRHKAGGRYIGEKHDPRYEEPLPLTCGGIVWVIASPFDGGFKETRFLPGHGQVLARMTHCRQVEGHAGDCTPGP